MRKILLRKPNLNQKLQYKFPRRTIQASGKNEIWAVDLVDMNSEKLSQSGYILNCVDVLTRYAQSVRLHGKDKDKIQAAFIELFELFKAKPKLVWSDMESAIVGLNEWFQGQSIELYHVDNSYMGPTSHSVSIVERFNRTMKEAMFEYKSEVKSRNWNQVITHTINNWIPVYNKTPHSTIKTTPYEAYHSGNNIDQLELQYKREFKVKKEPKDTLSVGDFVFVQKPKEVIRAKGDTKYFDVPYEIATVNDTNPTTYTIKVTNAKKQHDFGQTAFYRQQFILPKKE